MKHFLLCTFIVFIAFNTLGQQIETPVIKPNVDYLKISKSQKTSAIGLTTLGTAGLIATLLSDASQGFVTIVSLGTIEQEYKSHTVPYLLSAAAIGGGVMLFVASSRNSKKSKSINSTVHITMEYAPQLSQTHFGKTSFPAIGATISF